MDNDPTENMNLVRTKKTYLGALMMWLSDETLEVVEKLMQGNVEIYADNQFERFLNNGKLDLGVLIVNEDNETPERIRERERPPMKSPYPEPEMSESEKEIARSYKNININRSSIPYWRYEDVETQPQENDILVCLKADGKSGDRDGDRVLCSGVGKPANLREPAAIWEAPVGHAGEVVFLNTDGEGWRILKRVPEEGLEPVGIIPVVGDEVCCMPTAKPDEFPDAYSYHTPTTVRSVNLETGLIEMDSQIEDAEEEFDATIIAYFVTGRFRVLKRKYEPVETRPLKGDTMRSVDRNSAEYEEEHTALADGEPVGSDGRILWDTQYSENGNGLLTRPDGTGWRIVRRKYEPVEIIAVKGDRVEHPDEPGVVLTLVKVDTVDTKLLWSGSTATRKLVAIFKDGRGWRILRRIVRRDSGKFEPAGTKPIKGDMLHGNGYMYHPALADGVWDEEDESWSVKYTEKSEMLRCGRDGTGWRIVKRKELDDRLEPLGTTPIEGDDIVAPQQDGSLSPICTIKTVLKEDGWSIGTDGGRYDITYFADGDVLRILKRKKIQGPAISEKYEPLGTKAVVGDLVTFAVDGVTNKFVRKVKEVTETEVISSTDDGVNVGYDLRGFTEEGMPGQGIARFRILKRPDPDFSAPFDPEKGTVKVFVRGWQYESSQGPVRRMKTRGGQCYFSEARSKCWRRESGIYQHDMETRHPDFHEIPKIVANIWLRELMGQDVVHDVEPEKGTLRPQLYRADGTATGRMSCAAVDAFSNSDGDRILGVARLTQEEVLYYREAASHDDDWAVLDWGDGEAALEGFTPESPGTALRWKAEIQEQGCWTNSRLEKEEKDIEGWRSKGGIVRILEMGDGRCFAWGINTHRWCPEAKEARDFRSMEKTSYKVADMWYGAIEAQGLLKDDKPKEQFIKGWVSAGKVVQRLEMPDGRYFIYLRSDREWRIEEREEHEFRIARYQYVDASVSQIRGWLDQLLALELITKHDILGAKA